MLTTNDVKTQIDAIQTDLRSILQGINENYIDECCHAVYDRMKVLTDKLEKSTETITISIGTMKIIVKMNKRTETYILTSNLKDGCTDPPAECIGCAAIDGLESLILGHARSGIDISSKEYRDGIEIALDAIGNNT